MILIIGGVLCYDAFMQCEFTLYAYIIVWTGDILALSKVMNIIHIWVVGFVIFEEFIYKNIDMFIFLLI